MLGMVVRNWWTFLVRGILAIIFGTLALAWPNATLLALMWLFGAFALADGILAMATGIDECGHYKDWWVVLLEGLVGVVIGLITFLWPAITGLILLYLIATWALVTGIIEVMGAIKLRGVINDEWWLAISGVLSFVLGILLVIFPGAGALALVWLIGLFAIAFGTALVVFAFTLHGLYREVRHEAHRLETADGLR
jgi:uncharacterized membrane protein HdeD (DUF308 family)